MSLSLTEKAVEGEQQVKHKVLVAEDDYGLREALEDTLSLANYDVVTAKNAEQAIELLSQQEDIQMVISDINMGEMSGHDLLLRMTRAYSHIPVLLMTAYGSIRDSVGAIRNGAVDYLVKPFEPKELVDIVSRQLGHNTGPGDEAPAVEDQNSKQLLQLARRVAISDSTVLISGESGTGKEVLARYIHQQSARAKKPFIAINCAAIPENMLEAMLFGYEKGAYTGAYNSAPGKFEQANGGTLLLDEISEMDIGLQAKLLRVLQEQEVERLGGRKTIPLDVRVIATSNRNMSQQVSEGRFREDLFYRLSVLPLIWKPLRQRVDDILPLAQKLLRKHMSKQKRSHLVFSQEAEKALMAYEWPGNVRELDNVIQRALILQTGSTIYEEDLGLETFSTSPSEKIIISEEKNSGFRNHLRKVIPSSTSNSVGPSRPFTDEGKEISQQLGDNLQKREFEIIVETLREEQGSRKNTAKRLGISPRTLRYKLAKMREAGLVADNKLREL
ncbi:sigma-54-dependent Fis family transcriptional regulator [Candidatus Endobugula sertula]|uniref:Sigma-54-dependent Fis family transcriptional regulator n=1 Tax=Candidatus Endobugula sertula TaxID=62101 RepID=A0A1D2QTR3_9GAMM|nr:sigma-54-dependent Fis family transcriptional regulator [Candidatus Endobugula sertula]